jgi:hypothetical protein
MTSGERKIASDLLNCIPTNWVDPLLTGGNKVISSKNGKYDGQDIENLLLAIRKRMTEKLGI